MEVRALDRRVTRAMRICRQMRSCSRNRIALLMIPIRYIARLGLVTYVEDVIDSLAKQGDIYVNIGITFGLG